MARQYDESLEESFEYRGERRWLIRPRTREEWLNALEVRDMLKEEWSMLMHDEDDSDLSALLNLQEEYINEYRDSLADFHNGTLSKNIAFLVKSNGLKIGDLENVLGLSSGYISRTARENSGKKLSIDVVWKLAELFDISVDKLIANDISVSKGNIGLLFSFMDKIQHQTESVDIEWLDFGKEEYLDDIMVLKKYFVNNEDGSIRYLVPGFNPEAEFVLADDVIGTYDVREDNMLVIIPFRLIKSASGDRVHYDFVFIKDDQDEEAEMIRVFNSMSYPFDDLDERAEILYQAAKEHIMDVPVTSDMRKFITSYLEKEDK